MIVAAGLTPAWQQILRFERLRPGEVNRGAEAHWCALGKVFNVGIALANLGAECRAISPLGADVAQRVGEELAAVGLQSSLIPQHGPTRVCTTLLDDATGAVTELVENARPLPPETLDEFRTEYARHAAAAGVAVLSGSLPAKTPPTFYRELLEQTPGRAALTCAGRNCSRLLVRRPWFVKPNREELRQTLGRSLDDDRGAGGRHGAS